MAQTFDLYANLYETWRTTFNRLEHRLKLNRSYSYFEFILSSPQRNGSRTVDRAQVDRAQLNAHNWTRTIERAQLIAHNGSRIDHRPYDFVSILSRMCAINCMRSIVRDQLCAINCDRFTVRDQLCAINCAAINCAWSIVRDQLCAINCARSIVPDQLCAINCPRTQNSPIKAKIIQGSKNFKKK
jgi:hypothetical protein